MSISFVAAAVGVFIVIFNMEKCCVGAMAPFSLTSRPPSLSNIIVARYSLFLLVSLFLSPSLSLARS